MQIEQGTEGGILFRYNSTDTTGLYFGISTDGHWRVESIDIDRNSYNLLGHGQTSAIKRDQGYPPKIAVVANGTNIDLYINYQKITQVPDNHYSKGQVGCAVVANINSQDAVGEAAFTNAMVWTLDQ